jgi:hypothetical protein
MEYNKISYADLGKDIARVNKHTDEIQLNNNIFDRLPDSLKNLVLLYEQDKLVLKTAEEFQSNRYAANLYTPIYTSKDEFGHHIVVMKKRLTPSMGLPFSQNTKPDINEFDNFTIDPISAIADATAKIVGTLPALGIGSKQRINETKAAAAGQVSIIQSQTQLEAQAGADQKELAQVNGRNYNNMIILSIGGLLLLIIGYFTVKSL